MIHFDHSKCTHCGLCASNCSVHAIVEKNGAYQCSNMFCFHCNQCVAICPTGAITAEDMEPAISYDKATFDLSPDTLLNALRFRRSIRRFTGEKLTDQELHMLLEAGRCAPTSSNTQSLHFTVLDRDFELMRPKIWASFGKMCEQNGQTGLLRRYHRYLEAPDQPDTMFYGATQMIAVSSCRPIDGALGLANMELMCHAMGLGALYCGFATRAITFDEELREYFSLNEEGRHLDGCLIVGRTQLQFYRTAPRNPANVNWK